MLTTLKHNLAGLFRFSGRTSRRRFWPYAAMVIGLVVIGMVAVIVPTVSDAVARMQRFAIEHPELVTETRGPGSYSIQVEGYHPELIPDFGAAVTGMAMVMLLAVLLLAASVARRLHDRDRPGWWGLLPLPFLAFGMIATRYLMTSAGGGIGPDMTLILVLFFNNLAYLGLLLTLIVLLAGSGTPGANRFGEAPD